MIDDKVYVSGNLKEQLDLDVLYVHHKGRLKKSLTHLHEQMSKQNEQFKRAVIQVEIRAESIRPKVPK